ncbi:hypothetical protein LIER_15070 [Lithospermum erythrorhizon]|uniref:Uncharacterized protein n=1 Tax=Lithospermum erythrorhizon TaxID=34254 RepID=A0AAV3Q2Z1_LITER
MVAITGEMIDRPMVNPAANKGDPMEEGYTPFFWEFLNYDLRLPVSAFVNNVLVAIDRAPSQLGPFPWATLTAFQVRNMLYHGKPGKASPSRWHKYWFLVKDAFSDKVRTTFSTVHTTLEVEESPKVAVGLKNLEDGFPKTLSLDIFCDLDVLIKAGLSKSIDNFPQFDLGEGWEGCHSPPSELLGCNIGESAWSPRPPPSTVAPNTDESVREQSMAPDERFSPLLPTLSLADRTTINPEVLILPNGSSSFHEAPASPDLLYTVPSWNVTEETSRASEGLASWTSLERGFKNDHPFFVDLPYTLPSRLQITLDTVSTPTASIAAKILKNCMLRPSVLGVLGTQPSSLFVRFSYHQIKVAADYLGIFSHFTNFVTALGEDYVVSFFDVFPEDEPTDNEDASGSDSSEDGVGDET